jgi:hypothetical protein
MATKTELETALAETLNKLHSVYIDRYEGTAAFPSCLKEIHDTAQLLAKKRPLEGVDRSLEISLKGYGFAWLKGVYQTVVFYGTQFEDESYLSYDYQIFNNSDRPERDWPEEDLEIVYSFIGLREDEFYSLPIEQRLYNLKSYYGPENIFGPELYHLSYSEVRLLANRMKVI